MIGGRAALVFSALDGPHCHAAEPVRGEVDRYLPVLAAKRHLDLAQLVRTFAALPVTWHGAETYAAWESEARRRLAGRDETDWPTLALALTLALPVWSQDKDFSITGVVVFTTGDLLDALP